MVEQDAKQDNLLKVVKQLTEKVTKLQMQPIQPLRSKMSPILAIFRHHSK